jgi:hypothetical protein
MTGAVRAVGLAAVAGMLLVLGGCGGTSPTTEAKQVAVGYYADLGAGNVRAACRRLAPAAVRRTASAALRHSDSADIEADAANAAVPSRLATTCPKLLADTLRAGAVTENDASQLQLVKVIGASVDGGIAHLELSGVPSAPVPAPVLPSDITLTHTPAGWQITKLGD